MHNSSHIANSRYQQLALFVCHCPRCLDKMHHVSLIIGATSPSPTQEASRHLCLHV